MSCIFQQPLTDEQLYDALNGTADAQVESHLQQCESCRERLKALEFQIRLQNTMHPTLDELLDFQSDLLEGRQRQLVASHLKHCRLCQREIAALEALDAEPLDPDAVPLQSTKPKLPARPALKRPRQPMIAHLLPPTSSRAGQGVALLGPDDTLIAETDDVRIYLSPQVTRKGIVLFGQLKTNDRNNQSVWNAAVVTLETGDGESQTTLMNEFGEFTFPPVPPGISHLHIQSLANISIELDSLQLGRDADE